MNTYELILTLVIICIVSLSLGTAFIHDKDNNFCKSKGYLGADNYKNKYLKGYVGCYHYVCNDKNFCVKEYIGIKGD